MVQTIITAAGNSERLFLDAGFDRPKNLLKIDGQAVLSRAIESYRSRSAILRIGLSAREAENWPEIAEVVSKTEGAQAIFVPPTARGALITALYCAADVEPDRPLVVAAGDSSIERGISNELAIFEAEQFDAATITFQSSGERWSYVSLDRSGKVSEVTEKYQSGNLATTGGVLFPKGKILP